MINSRLRWFGTFFLVVAAGLLIWGQTLLSPYLTGIWYLVYWLVCLIFTALAMITALLDMRAVRSRIREQHRQIVVNSFPNSPPSKTPQSTQSSPAPPDNLGADKRLRR